MCRTWTRTLSSRYGWSAGCALMHVVYNTLVTSFVRSSLAPITRSHYSLSHFSLPLIAPITCSHYSLPLLAPITRSHHSLPSLAHHVVLGYLLHHLHPQSSGFLSLQSWFTAGRWLLAGVLPYPKNPYLNHSLAMIQASTQRVNV